MIPLFDVVTVKATYPDLTLALQFENGEVRVFDMNPLMTHKPFNALSDPKLFLKAHVVNGTVTWPGDIDIAPETLYEGSRPM